MGRRDVAVLYLDRLQTIDGSWVETLIEVAAPVLTGVVPQLTLALAPGVGWAADPGDSLSYGQLLCRTLAEVATGDGALASEDAWLDAARRALAGVVPDGLEHAQP